MMMPYNDHRMGRAAVVLWNRDCPSYKPPLRVKSLVHIHTIPTNDREMRGYKRGRKNKKQQPRYKHTHFIVEWYYNSNSMGVILDYYRPCRSGSRRPWTGWPIIWSIRDFRDRETVAWNCCNDPNWLGYYSLAAERLCYSGRRNSSSFYCLQ